MSFRFTQSITRVFQYYLEVEAARKRVLAQRMKGRCGGVCVTIDAYCRVLKIDVEKRDLYTDPAKPGSAILKESEQLCLDVKVAVWDAVAKIQKLKMSERAKIGTPPAGAQPSSMVDALTLRPYPYEAITGEHELSVGLDDPRTGGKHSAIPRYFDNYVTTDKYLQNGGGGTEANKTIEGNAPAEALEGKSTEERKAEASSPADTPDDKQYPDIPRSDHYKAASEVLSNGSKAAESEGSEKEPTLNRKSKPRLLSWIAAMHREATGGIGGVASFSKHMMAVLLASEDPARVLEIQRQHMSMEEKNFWNRVDVIRKAQENTIKVPLDKRREYRDFDYKSSSNRYSENYESRSDKSVTGHVGN